MANPYELAPNGFAVDLDNAAHAWLDSARGRAATTWRRTQIAGNISSRYGTCWFADGDITDWLTDYVSTARANRKLPVLAPYNIMGRDLGWHSGGGAVGVTEYLAWVEKWTLSINTAPCVVVLEPDSVIHQLGLTDEKQAIRQAVLSRTVARVAERCPNAWTYLDGGVHSEWHNPAAMARLLLRSGVLQARGIFVNVANFMRTADAAAHARRIIAELKRMTGKDFGFIVDTSRNGSGPPATAASDWMINPKDRKLGEIPSYVNSVGADALFWGKLPGVSDGLGGTPSNVPSGVFDDRIAISLILGKWTP